MEEPLRVIDLLIPGACPPVPTGPVSLVKGEQCGYVAENAALPPHWSDARRLGWECAREDAVILRWRRGITKSERDRAYRWLLRHGLDDHGRPKVWNTPALAPEPPAETARPAPAFTPAR